MYSFNRLFDGGFLLSEYLLSVIGTVLFSAVLTAILPSGKTTAIIKSTARLACLVVVLSPVLDFFKNGELFGENFMKTGIQTDRNYIEYCSKISVESAEKSLAEHLKTEYGIEFEVNFLWEEVRTEERGYEVERIKIVKVVLSPLIDAVTQKQEEEIRAYLLEYFNCPLEVIRNDLG